MYKKNNILIYTVNKDDTLYKIVKKYDVSVKILMRTNPYSDVYNLHEGEELSIPIN